MYKGIHLLLAVWSIIIGGLIIFINGKGWCIACNGSIFTGAGVVSLVLGLINVVVIWPRGAGASGRQ